MAGAKDSKQEKCRLVEGVPPGGIVHTEAAWAQLGAKGFFAIKCSEDSCQGAKGEADQGPKGEADQGAFGHHVMLYFCPATWNVADTAR